MCVRVCVCVCICIYIYTHIHIYIYTHTLYNIHIQHAFKCEMSERHGVLMCTHFVSDIDVIASGYARC